MGTGVVVDPRGYVLTNNHVVDGVREIKVTLADGTRLIARVVAHDPVTDLAIITIPLERPLPVISIGTSTDLMEGEEVVAVGNAYGYEHTVTRGIISALHRTVQVTDTQMYYDLIQTDASINPGNSGGPLLNVDGEMIGVNVAVRVGTRESDSRSRSIRRWRLPRLLSAERRGVWHGLVPADSADTTAAGVFARQIESGSPAEAAGVQQGDRILRVNNLEIRRRLDLERAILGQKAGQETALLLQRNGQPVQVRMRLASLNARSSRPTGDDVTGLAWEKLGLRLAENPVDEAGSSASPFRGGLRVLAVRSGGPAARQGVRAGDVLVGLHRWETASTSDLAYILKEPSVAQRDVIKFYVLRGEETLYGHLPVTWRR